MLLKQKELKERDAAKRVQQKAALERKEVSNRCLIFSCVTLLLQLKKQKRRNEVKAVWEQVRLIREKEAAVAEIKAKMGK